MCQVRARSSTDRKSEAEKTPGWRGALQTASLGMLRTCGRQLPLGAHRPTRLGDRGRGEDLLSECRWRKAGSPRESKRSRYLAAGTWRT
ncbi:hypothetical protein NDU88_003526 [Pleurodeles waltl]|uniref:Uncharacterized protein n=1 Tax=Pleurodeles waltl TaxID=8319 RepID=A0AAV7LLV3_PLEWA|nr:hypothetical protein NDU88_003526 [Pleurodeles waltl]